MRRGLFSRLGVSLLAHVYECFECSGGVCADVVQPCVERAGVLALPRADLLRDSEGLLQRHDFRPARLSVLHALVLLLVAVLMIPANAWADVLPDTPDETVLGTKVGRAVDPNSAVFVAVGKSIDSLTSEQQAAFINATSGTEGLESYAYFRGTMYTPTSTVGPVSATYYSTLTGTEYAMACAAARSDIVNYLKGSSSGGGGSSGGGSSGETSAFPSSLTLTTIYAGSWASYNSSMYKCIGAIGNSSTNVVSWGVENGTYQMAPQTIGVTFTDAMVQTITSKMQEVGYSNAIVALGNSQGTTSTAPYNRYQVIITLVPSNSLTLKDNTSFDSFGYYVNSGSTYYRATLTQCKIIDNAIVFNSTGITFTTNTASQDAKTGSNYPLYAYSLVGAGGGGGGGTTPEPDPTPVQPVNPTGPTITGPTINVNTGGNNSSTTTADLTPILEMLRIINGNVIVINDNLTAFSDWFGDAWGDYVDWLQLWFERFGLSLDNIYAQQELVGQNIVSELREIEDVLWYIFYKPDPEYPTPAAYDDSAVLAKLQEIIDYLGGFETDYEPDIDDGNTAGEQLAADVSSLKTKFPFCMPFELHALLALLQAPMEIPVFTVTLPMWGTLTFDMAQWSDSLAICRACSILWVIGGLFTLTSKMISYFGMPSLGGD